MYIAHIASSEFIYRNLGESASWEDPIKKYFEFKDETQEHTFEDMRSWSNSYNDFNNWVNLNSIMAMSSNLETYMATVINLSLESDVGVLFGAKNRIDGIEIIKNGRHQPFNFEDKIVSCTKGEWGSRVNAFSNIFGEAPQILLDNISSLEKLRKIRNNVGHAFGRDIKNSRNHAVIDIVEMKKINREKTLKYQKLMFGISRAIDKQLLSNHIGEYQTVYFYHNLKLTFKDNEEDLDKKINNLAWVLKKKIGRFGAAKAGKKFCRGLIEYYEAL